MCIYVCVEESGEIVTSDIYGRTYNSYPPTLIFDRIGWGGVKLLLLHSKIVLESGLKSSQYIHKASDENEKDETASV